MRKLTVHTELIAVLIASLMLFLSQARAEEEKRKIYISLGEANVKQAVIAIPRVMPTGLSAAHPVLQEIRETLTLNAELSNLFRVIPESAFLEPATAGVKIGTFKFTDWAPIGAEFLFKTNLILQGQEFVLQTFLYDVYQGTLVNSWTYKSQVNRARSAAHAAIDDVIEALTGMKGISQTRIVMLCKSRRGKAYISELYAMDQDGKAMKQITRDGLLKLFPAWSRDGKWITYTVFNKYGKKGHNQDLMIYNTQTGQTRILFSKVGLNTGSSVWHPNNKSLLLSVSYEGTRSIYSLKVNADGTAGGPLQRVIQSEGFDLEPDYSPDGSRMTFSSYRAGRPMIFTAKSDGAAPERKTFAGHYNSAPVWSPLGDKIVFQGQYDQFGFFDLFVMSPKGTNMERLTMHNGKSNENASFSPDGRHIVFSSNEPGNYQVFRMNMEGTGRKRLSYLDGYECLDPSWGPRF